MKREMAVFLILGSMVILLLEAPSAISSVISALRGPYPESAATSPNPVSIRPAYVKAGFMSTGSLRNAGPEAGTILETTLSSESPSYLPSLAEN